MSENSSENKQWHDPKDYGLPFVEVTPLNPEVIKEPVSDEKLPEDEVIVPVLPKVKTSVVEEKEAKPIQEEKIEETLVENKKKETVDLKTDAEEQVFSSNPTVSDSTITAEKKSNSWVPIVLILAVLIISVIVWQLMSQGNESISSGNQLTQQEIPKVEDEAVQPTVENTPTQEIQTPENQDSIPKSISSLEEPVETPQTGTTIDLTGIETLIRVESKSDRPQYFIVVGSLPNERMAIAESEQYLDRTSSVYMILPYEDVRNYRLAIGSFTSFRKASEELETIKDQYTEALWILKY